MVWGPWRALLLRFVFALDHLSRATPRRGPNRVFFVLKPAPHSGTAGASRTTRPGPQRRYATTQRQHQLSSRRIGREPQPSVRGRVLLEVQWATAGAGALHFGCYRAAEGCRHRAISAAIAPRMYSSRSGECHSLEVAHDVKRRWCRALLVCDFGNSCAKRMIVEDLKDCAADSWDVAACHHRAGGRTVSGLRFDAAAETVLLDEMSVRELVRERRYDYERDSVVECAVNGS